MTASPLENAPSVDHNNHEHEDSINVHSTLPESHPELDLDMGFITEEPSRIFTPPPHIAARFYRPSTSRRQSSAASSRRNSISSAHSHNSHNHSHHHNQSNHVAQYLRRASILEDRKARLADRAAHAEKVRLRAAMAKGQRRPTNHEERALAAQQARERNLAEIVASCAEEVKRAKGIAESMKEKREAEVKRLRKDMEDRLAEAERRREELLQKANAKRGRSTSQPRKPPSPVSRRPVLVDEAVAAARIQTRWRIYQRYKDLKEFSNLELTIDRVRETPFEIVLDLLAQENILLSTAKMLRLCGLKEGESGSIGEMTAVRTFLSAFIILGHPAQVLSSKGEANEQETVGAVPVSMARNDLANPQLQDLVAKASDLLISFEDVLSRLNPTNGYAPPSRYLSSLSEVYAAYYNAFITWKARDSSTLIDMMVMQFVELDSIWHTVKDSTEEAVTGSYREGIRENQLKLMVRIKRLAGPVEGKRLITNAIRDARKTRAAKKPIGDSKPRAADVIPDVSVLQDISASEKSVTARLQTLTPPATPRKTTRTSTGADDLRSASSVLPDNRIVVHELAMSKEYRIEMDDCFEQRGNYNQLIFDSMRAEVAVGNSDPWVLAMADNIKGKLQRLLTAGNSMHTLIGEALDTDVVARELQCGTFSYEKFFSFMGSILPKLCAPFRDAEIKQLVENELSGGDDIVGRLQALLHFIDLMQLDYANFMLQHSAPDLIKHSTAYEVKRFSDIMSATDNSLTATETAWRIARTKVLKEAARRDPENINHPRARPTPERFYAQMLVDVFASVGGSSPIPETLQLDSKRIQRIRTEILRIATIGAILLQAKNLLKRDVRSQWKVEATRIFSVFENSKSEEQTTIGVQAALESSRSMPVATKKHIKALVTRIVSMSYASSASSAAASITPPASFSASAASSIPSSSEPTDPVIRLLLTRLRAHILARLSATTEREKIRATSTAGEQLAGMGLAEFVSKIGAIVDEMGRVGTLDRQAHGPWYELVAGNVGEEEQV